MNVNKFAAVDDDNEASEEKENAKNLSPSPYSLDILFSPPADTSVEESDFPCDIVAKKKNDDEKRLNGVEWESDETHEALLKLLFFRVEEKCAEKKTRKREKSKMFIQQKSDLFQFYAQFEARTAKERSRK